MDIKSRMLVVAALGLAVAGLAAPGWSQEAPADRDTVTVTAEERQEAFESQMQAERTAGEARREFAGLRDGHGDRAAGCRNAAEADREYGMAIAEAERAVDGSPPAARARIEQRIRGMRERRENLDDVSDRICRGANAMAGGARGHAGLGNGRGARRVGRRP